MRIKALLLAACCVPTLAAGEIRFGFQGDAIALSATPPAIEILPLQAPSPGAVGLLPSSVTGLPGTMWLKSDPAVIRELIETSELPVPALRGLMRNLMLAEAEPPGDAGDGIAHLGMRLDWLQSQGAVEEALAMLDIVEINDPDLFSRWVDLNLLLDRSVRVCRKLDEQPNLSSDFSLWVYCTARDGDWRRANLTLANARILGDVSDRRADLLERFLDPEYQEDSPPLLPPVRPSPLEFRLFEALGEPLPTAPLPLAFSVLDLNGDNGWRPQVEAAERLARVGSLPSNRLLGFYTLREPAASGGVWDRIAAVQHLETVLKQGRVSRVERALVSVWPQMRSPRLLDVLAELFAADLPIEKMTGRAAALSHRAAFLSPEFEELSKRIAPATPELRFLTAIARGDAPDLQDLPDLPHAQPVALGFAATNAPEALAAQIRQDRIGEVLLRAMALFASGARGNASDLTDALATFRALGAEETARRAALQIVLLDAERARR